jgi:threonine/homoserine/homoserine lactone efflux protein
MTFEHFVALLSFGAVAAFTPGPNNTLLMASGVNFGFRRSLPLILGVTFGFPLMIGLVGLGLGQVFSSYAALYTVLKYAGAAYMLFLAWKIATSKPAMSDERAAAHPMSFLQMALFQWVNPKGWIMAVTALSAYTTVDQYYSGVAVVVATFVVMGITSATAWTMFGAGLKQVMSDPRYFRAINIGLALLLVASLWPILASH